MIDKYDVNREVLKLFSQHSEIIQNYILDATAVSIGIFDFEGKALVPDGHFKIPHLWPGQNPPATE